MRTPIREHMKRSGFVDPFHLGRLCDAIDKSGMEYQRIVFKCAPRSGVTTLLLETPSALPGMSFGISTRDFDLAVRYRRQQPSLYACGHGSPMSGFGITGAFFVDKGQHVDPDWIGDTVATRTTPHASILVIGVDIPDAKIERFKQLGYSINWA